MRLLHTSDWHLGQQFMGRSRHAEQRAFLDWLIARVQAEAIDVVLVAGDLFDTATPSSAARALYNHFAVAMHAAGVQLVLLGGNHDAPAVLGENRELLACLSVQVIPAIGDDPADQVLLLQQRDGQPGAVLAAVPYLRPRDLLTSQPGQDSQALQQAIAQHYQCVYDLACARRDALAQQNSPPSRRLPVFTTGHLLTAGSPRSESVRELYIGTLEALPRACLPPADYIALGHLHRAQKVGGDAHVRYCGAPLPLAFDETGTEKVVLRVDTAGYPETGCQVTPLPVPAFRKLLTLHDTPDALASRLQAEGEAWQATATDNPDHPLLPMWVEIVVEASELPPDIAQHLQHATASLPLEILRIRRAQAATPAVWDSPDPVALAELNPDDVFAARLASETEPETMQAALWQAYREVVQTLQHGESMTADETGHEARP